MQGAAMERICNKFESDEISLSKMTALEFFARAGDWQTIKYAQKVKKLYAWEIDPIFENDLKGNLPNAEIIIGDSFQLSENRIYHNIFDLIVSDNPQNTFGFDNEYCEHFEVLPLIKKLLKDSGIVIFNVNYNPFDYNKFPQWEERRRNFYKIKETQFLSIDFIQNFYTNYWEKDGFKVDFMFLEPRNDEYLTYVVQKLNKIS